MGRARQRRKPEFFSHRNEHAAHVGFGGSRIGGRPLCADIQNDVHIPVVDDDEVFVRRRNPVSGLQPEFEHGFTNLLDFHFARLVRRRLAVHVDGAGQHPHFGLCRLQIALFGLFAALQKAADHQPHGEGKRAHADQEGRQRKRSSRAEHLRRQRQPRSAGAAQKAPPASRASLSVGGMPFAEDIERARRRRCWKAVESSAICERRLAPSVARARGRAIHHRPEVRRLQCRSRGRTSPNSARGPV